MRPMPIRADCAPAPPALWRRYLELTKPKVVALITFTAVVGTLLASPGLPPLDALVWGNLGIALAAASAAAINHVLDRRIDAQMARTRARPLPTGALRERQAPAFAARRDDYARAGIPMLPVTHGVAYTRLQVLLYTVLLVVVTLMPYLTRMSGLAYLAAALLLNAGFLYYALALKMTAREELPLRVFRFSVTYLMWLFAALLVDHYLPALRAGGP